MVETQRMANSDVKDNSIEEMQSKLRRNEVNLGQTCMLVRNQWSYAWTYIRLSRV